MLFCAVATFDSPVTPVLSTTVQVYVVPDGTMLPVDEFSVGATVKAEPLHVTGLRSEYAAADCELRKGLGFTVTVTINVEPIQPLDVGVTV